MAIIGQMSAHKLDVEAQQVGVEENSLHFLIVSC